ncbi:hypothetical protein GCM10010519_09840 [Streptomyces lactacystinicus]
MPPTALRALARLIDRTFARVAAAAVDARTFDRALIARETRFWSDVEPAVAALAARPGTGRALLARRTLRWIADHDADRHDWAAEDPGTAGLLLPPRPDDPSLPSWDVRGHIAPPWSRPLGEDARAALSPYDPTDCRFLGLEAEFRRDRLDAALTVQLPRRYDAGERVHAGARLGIELEAVSELSFTSGSGPTGALTWHTGNGRVEVLAGEHGRLVAERAVLRIGDACWHLSEPGRSAAAVTPRHRDERRPEEWPLGPAFALAFPHHASSRLASALVRQALAGISRARRVERVDQRHILTLCRVFEGAGTELLAAGAHGGRAFRRLILRWVERGGEPLTDWFAGILHVNSRGGPTGAWARKLAVELARRSGPRPPGPWTPPPEPPPELPRTAVLRLLSVDFDERRHERSAAGATVQFAVPPTDGGGREDGWDLSSVGIDGLDRLRLSPGAFAGPDRLEPLRRRKLSLESGSALALSWHDGRVPVAWTGWPTAVGRIRAVGPEPVVPIVPLPEERRRGTTG